MKIYKIRTNFTLHVVNMLPVVSGGIFMNAHLRVSRPLESTGIGSESYLTRWSENTEKYWR